MKILATRTFASDAGGMPVSRQLALSDQQEPESQRGCEPVSDDLARAWLMLTGVQAIDHEPPETFAEAYLAATGVPAVGSKPAEQAEPAESDLLGRAWVAATSAGWA